MRFLHPQLKNRFLHFKIYFPFFQKYNVKKNYWWGKYNIYIYINVNLYKTYIVHIYVCILERERVC